MLEWLLPLCRHEALSFNPPVLGRRQASGPCVGSGVGGRHPSRLVTLRRVLVLAARQMKPEVKLLLSLALVTLVANLGAWYYRRAAASELQASAAEEERGLLRMTALCRAGKGEEARAEAADFSRRYPSSPLRSRVLAACPGRP
jgi:hypothetical protein